MKKLYKNNKFKISALIWNEKFELPDGSYSVSYIQHYFGYIIKNYQTVADNPYILRIHENKTENRIKFEIKTGYHIEL